jgi:hypothetical protein
VAPSEFITVDICADAVVKVTRGGETRTLVRRTDNLWPRDTWGSTEAIRSAEEVAWVSFDPDLLQVRIHGANPAAKRAVDRRHDLRHAHRVG